MRIISQVLLDSNRFPRPCMFPAIEAGRCGSTNAVGYGHHVRRRRIDLSTTYVMER